MSVAISSVYTGLCQKELSDTSAELKTQHQRCFMSQWRIKQHLNVLMDM